MPVCYSPNYNGRGRHTHNTFLPPTEETTAYIISPRLHLLYISDAIIQRPLGREDNSLRARRLTLRLRHDARLQSQYPCSLRRRAREGRQIAANAHGFRLSTNCLSASLRYADTLIRSLHRYRLLNLSHRQLRLRHSRHNALRTLIIRPRCKQLPRPRCAELASHLLHSGSVSTASLTPR